MVGNTVKPIVFTAWSLENLKDIIEMAELLPAGRRIAAQSVLRPVHRADFAAEAWPRANPEADVHGRKGLPTVFTPGLMTGANGPVTIAGGLVQGNAEMLAGFVLAQLIREGTPLIYGGGMLPIDMRTTLMSYASPEFMMGVAPEGHGAPLPAADVPLRRLFGRQDLRPAGQPGRARCG